MEVGLPDTRDWPRLGHENLRNAALVLLTPVPAVCAASALFRGDLNGVIPVEAAWLLQHPLWTVNLFFFVFVNLQFWAVALVQRSSWLIDPYWTLIPLFIVAFYAAHPLATPESTRLGLAAAALGIWSARLTWNYFRREGWRFGFREDWRYAEMRRKRPHFWWEQFFVVHLAQHGMLVGLTLPFWAICFRPAPLTIWDFVFFAASLAGIAIAKVSDVQLDRFMRANQARRLGGHEPIPELDVGLWRWSRHPNYFGEQLFWWSIGGYGVVCGEPWVVVGTVLNSAVLMGVTIMTERRMLDVAERREAYVDYRRRTSVWIPWPPARAEARSEMS